MISRQTPCEISCKHAHKRNFSHSGPANITNGVETCFKIIQGLLKALEQGSKIFQKFVETRLLKKPTVSIHQCSTKLHQLHKKGPPQVVGLLVE